MNKKKIKLNEGIFYFIIFVFFYLNSEYNKMPAWVCARCSRTIEGGGEVLSCAMGTFHPGCFRCDECASPMATGRYVQVERGPIKVKLCGPCGRRRIEEARCFSCKQNVRTARRCIVGGRSVHEHCAVCAVCSKDLCGSAAFLSEDRKYLCEEVGLLLDRWVDARGFCLEIRIGIDVHAVSFSFSFSFLFFFFFFFFFF